MTGAAHGRTSWQTAPSGVAVARAVGTWVRHGVVRRALCVALSRVVAAWGAWASRWRFGAPLPTGRVTQLHTGKDVILGT